MALVIYKEGQNLSITKMLLRRNTNTLVPGTTGASLSCLELLTSDDIFSAFNAAMNFLSKFNNVRKVALKL